MKDVMYQSKVLIPPKEPSGPPKNLQKCSEDGLQPVKNVSRALPKAAWEAEAWKKQIFWLCTPIKVRKDNQKASNEPAQNPSKHAKPMRQHHQEVT